MTRGLFEPALVLALPNVSRNEFEKQAPARGSIGNGRCVRAPWSRLGRRCGEEWQEGGLGRHAIASDANGAFAGRNLRAKPAAPIIFPHIIGAS